MAAFNQIQVRRAITLKNVCISLCLDFVVCHFNAEMIHVIALRPR